MGSKLGETIGVIVVVAGAVGVVGAANNLADNMKANSHLDDIFGDIKKVEIHHHYGPSGERASSETFRTVDNDGKTGLFLELADGSGYRFECRSRDGWHYDTVKEVTPNTDGGVNTVEWDVNAVSFDVRTMLQERCDSEALKILERDYETARLIQTRLYQN